MMHPLRAFVSATDSTNDALILADIEDQIGSYAENLTSEDKLAFLAVLSRYLYFLQWVEPNYSIGAAITDTMLFYNTPQGSSDQIANATPETEEIWDILLTLEGISTESASGAAPVHHRATKRPGWKGNSVAYAQTLALFG